MTVVGVDLGTRRVALAIPSLSWCWRTDVERAAPRRNYPGEVDAGRELGRQAREAVVNALLERRKPAIGLEFWWERPLTLHGARVNVRTAVGQALSAGALLGQLPGSLHPIDAASTWKKELIGHGHAKPADYTRWLADHHPALAEACGEDEDLFAAHCIALWAGLAPRS